MFGYEKLFQFAGPLNVIHRYSAAQKIFYWQLVKNQVYFMILENQVHLHLNLEQQELQTLSFVLGKCPCFVILKNTMEIQYLSPYSIRML